MAPRRSIRTDNPLPAFGAVVFLAWGCGSTAERPTARELGIDRPMDGAEIQLSTSPELEEIALFEDRRDPGAGRLATFLGHEDPRVRERAAVALGRMPFPEFGSEVSDPLSRAVDDPVHGVRLAVIFALGVRGDPAGIGVLAARRNEPDSEIRASVIDALGRLVEDPVLQEEIALSLRDADLRVRGEAAEATALWDSDAPNASEIDRALLDALHPYTLSARDRALGRRSVESDLAWKLLYALSRRESSLGRGPFLEYLVARLPIERLFAARGLGGLEADREIVEALSQAALNEETLASADWRVSCEAAVSLGRLGDAQGLPALFELLDHKNTNVRVAAYTALGEFPHATQDVLPKLRQGLLDVSRAVRKAAIESLAAVLAPADALDFLDPAATDTEPIVRGGAATALAVIEAPRSFELLERLARDPSPFVATRAVTSIGALMDSEPRARPFLHKTLANKDNGLRLSAVTALAGAADETDLLPLAQCLKDSRGDIASEIAFGAVQALGAIGGEAATALVERALEDSRPHVRRVAQRVLIEKLGVEPAPDLPAKPRDTPAPPLAGEDYPLYERNPLVEISTTRGNLLFELFPAEAPLHVHNFLQLAQRDHYDQLGFHRVVPDFVAQGGDYRGDGNGAAPWQGEAMRQEFTPRKYVRGSLGMPRNEDPDSGGSQLFITHRPTPHLDGRYTVFGELRAGGEVLDRLELGDRILDVQLVQRP